MLSLGFISTILTVAGGPAGAIIAFLGHKTSDKTVKIVAIGLGLLLIAATCIGVTIWIEHLKADRAAYRALLADVTSLQHRYGCDKRPAHERAISACLTARERDAEQARAEKMAELQKAAAKAQAGLDNANAQLDAQAQQLEAYLAGAKGDGPMPQIVVDFYARQRAQRGR